MKPSPFLPWEQQQQYNIKSTEGEDQLFTWYLLYPLPQASFQCICDKISIMENNLNVNIFQIMNVCNFRLQKYWESPEAFAQMLF